jgi:hypothetical protein
LVEFNAVPVGVGDPRLPAVVAPKLGRADLDPRCFEIGYGLTDIVNLQADMAEGLTLCRFPKIAFEELDKVTLAQIKVDTVPSSVLVFKVERLLQA